MKTTLFISNGLQVDLGIYLPTGEIARSVKISKLIEGEYVSVVKVQGKNIVLTSDDNENFDVNNVLTRKANQYGNPK